MKRDMLRKEKGAVEVEATIILPIAILSVVLLMYLALFMYQRAHLQASLETALVYYKSTLTDTFVTKNGELKYTMETTAGEGGAAGTKTYMASGNSYKITDGINPYRGLFGDEYDIGDDATFKAFFNSVAGDNFMFRDTLQVQIDYSNFVLLKQIKASAVQTVRSPIDFSILGAENSFTIYAAAKVNVIDHDASILLVDYAIDLVEDTKFGQAAKDFAAKCGEWYNSMLDKLGVEK